jgi:hypothetical protein
MLHISDSFWYGAMVVVPVLGGLFPWLRRGFKEWRDERLLLKGHRGAPDMGIQPMPTLGKRFADVEAVVESHTFMLKAQDDTLAAQDAQLAYLVAQWSPNHGESPLDKIDALAEGQAALTQAVRDLPCVATGFKCRMPANED